MHPTCRRINPKLGLLYHVARPTFEKKITNHVQRAMFLLAYRRSGMPSLSSSELVNGTDEISSCIPSKKPHQERGSNTLANTSFFFFESRFKRTRPTAKKRWEPHTSKLQSQVLVGHHFGEFTVSVTLHEDVSDCLRSEIHRRKNKGEGKCGRRGEVFFVIRQSSPERPRTMLKK